MPRLPLNARHPAAYIAAAAAVISALAVIAFGLALAPTPPGPPAWRGALAGAVAEAKAAGKDVLVEFTRRDSGGELPALDALVFDRPQFLRGVDRRFVPVRLVVDADSPDAAVVTLAERLAVARVPSLVLMDGDGRPYAAVDSQSEQIPDQLELIERAAAKRVLRDEALLQATGVSGVERARRLHAALQHVAPFASTGYEPIAREIVSLDADNAAGLRDVYSAPLAEGRIDSLVQSVVYPLIDRADFAGAVTAIETIISQEKPPTHQLQMLMAFKGQVLFSMGRKDDARRVLHDSLALSPDSTAAARVRAAVRQLDD